MKNAAVLLMVLLLMLSSVTLAQNPGRDELTPDEIQILNTINDLRLDFNLSHLVPNTQLNAIADQFVADLQARAITNLGDVYRLRDNRNIENLLQEAAYGRYNSNFIADFIPIILRDVPPSDVIDFWRNDWRSAPEERTLLNRQAVLQGEVILPFFSPLYREIGISASFNRSNERYYYVIIFAAQPNALPIVITQLRTLNQIPQVVDTRDVILYMHDERINRFGVGDIMGAVDSFRVSETGEQLECPATTGAASETGWESPYVNNLTYTLSPGIGSKTVYVQFCDDLGRTITSSASVEFRAVPTGTPPSLPGLVRTPDVLGIANATQTAAASATAYAPYEMTIEAILTQTAAPLATATP